jgi:predicted HTH domain antitoxin
MSTLHIPDGILKQAGITEQEAVIELACRLFDTGKLTLFFAAQLAGMPQPQFEDLLLERNIPIYRYTDRDLQNDLKTLRQSGT